MKLNTTYSELESLLQGSSSNTDGVIDQISIDSRSIINGQNTLFVALKGNFRDGHDFVHHAYAQGVRFFMIERDMKLEEDAHKIIVSDSLEALQKIAANHRSKFDIPVIGITGSNGKTIVKEWLAEVLSQKFNVHRSPKSYNSQIGVALSLLELKEDHQIAIIEAGISKPNEMVLLEKMIKPSMGVLTNIGNAHIQNFESTQALYDEKMKLFQSCAMIYTLRENNFNDPRFVQLEILDQVPDELNDTINKKNLSIVSGIAMDLGYTIDQIQIELLKLHALANRLERFEGKNDCIVINDSYSLDTTALRLSLETQIQVAGNKERILIVGIDQESEHLKEEIEALCTEFKVKELLFVQSNHKLEQEFSNACILLKGNRKAHVEKIASELKLRKHQTYLEIDLEAIRNNILSFKSRLLPETKIMAMVKASSYGSDAQKMGAWLENVGVDYLGVAYVEEGLELRNKGMKSPIMVMNVHESNFTDCILNDLEPAIYSLEQLDQFITELIYLQAKHFPIHLKIETGMNRLGFIESEISRLCSILASQPEVYVKSIYSHLATADSDITYARTQVKKFTEISKYIEHQIGYPTLKHILNSEGILKIPEAQFHMVRLGIGMYGISTDQTFSTELRSALSWYSTISQIKNVKSGESIGYNRSFIATDEMKIAIIPVGYADGFNRKFSNGVGSVYINGHICKVLGNVCMDMIMVDVTEVFAKEGDRVELFGAHINVTELASKLGTIPYEIFTSVSSRVTRTYIND